MHTLRIQFCDPDHTLNSVPVTLHKNVLGKLFINIMSSYSSFSFAPSVITGWLLCLKMSSV